MRYYKQHHKILEMLYNQFIVYDNDNKQNIAVDFKDLCKALNCSMDEFHLISSNLFDNDEVQLMEVRTIQGLFLKPKGFTAYGEKKYLRERKSFVFEQTKNWVQVSIPVLSLLLAIAIYLKSEARIKEQQLELQAIKLQVKQFQDSQIQFQPSLRRYPDSIGVKK